jgi:hypothetical protein
MCSFVPHYVHYHDVITHSNFEINIYFTLTLGIHILESHKHMTHCRITRTIYFNNHSKIHRLYMNASNIMIVYVNNDMSQRKENIEE